MFKAGKLNAYQLPTGTIVVEDDPLTSCTVKDAGGKTFTVELDVDLNSNKLSGKDQKEILDQVNKLADLVAEKLGFSVISKAWRP